MSNGTTQWLTVPLRLPILYNPDALGHRAPIEDDKFLETADEIARRFGGGVSGGIKASSTETCWH